jgi:hypothetical protein
MKKMTTTPLPAAMRISLAARFPPGRKIAANPGPQNGPVYRPVKRRAAHSVPVSAVDRPSLMDCLWVEGCRSSATLAAIAPPGAARLVQRGNPPAPMARISEEGGKAGSLSICGQHSQSIAPSRATNAALRRSPIKA